MKRKAFFSIYILLATIFGSVVHGPFMALAANMDSGAEERLEMGMYSGMMHHDESETVSNERLEFSNSMGNSIMPCCIEEGIYSEKEGIFQERKSEILNLEDSTAENESVFLAEKKSADVDLSYKYFSPPEKIILASVIKIE